MADLVPSERELEILKVLWDIGSGSVREVHEKMCPDGELAFNTVQTLLRIMEDKGLVGHKAKGRTFIYFSKFNRQRASSQFLQKVFDGSLDQLVVSMLGVKDASADELRQLEKLIAQARREKLSGAEKTEKNSRTQENP
ncbi:MAG TPA: BlaI/MecI/CopY family transcriptional regulator [Pirellulales bacterium]